MGSMKNKIAFIFPGQGSQIVGMGQDLYKSTHIAKEFYTIADDYLNFSLSSISFNGPNETLQKTIYTQPAIYVNSCILSYLFKNKGIYPDAFCGHSLGELSALYSSGAITFEDGLKIVKARSKAMYLSGKKKPGTMVAFIGVDKNQIRKICDNKEVVVPANINSKDQIVISGSINGIEKAISTAQKMGVKRIFPLNVSGAFHSPLMNDAMDTLAETLKEIPFNDIKIPVYQNIDAKPELKGENLKYNFLNQLTNPVKWLNIIENISQNGINIFIEVGPGKVLQRLNRRINNNSVNFGISNINEINTFNYEY